MTAGATYYLETHESPGGSPSTKCLIPMKFTSLLQLRMREILP
jgi:hypothetical protein